MSFQTGNQCWKRRETIGRKPKFETAEEMWSACQRYFDWVESNPLYEQKCIGCRGEVVKAQVSKMRAMTVTGLCIHLGMTFETWSQYRKKPDFSEVTKYVEEIIRTQKFEGAAAGLFNANIIARDLGLRETVTNEHSGVAGQPIEVKAKTDREMARDMAFALAKGLRSPA